MRNFLGIDVERREFAPLVYNESRKRLALFSPGIFSQHRLQAEKRNWMRNR